MKRRTLLIGLGVGVGAFPLAETLSSSFRRGTGQLLAGEIYSPMSLQRMSRSPFLPVESWAKKLITAAESQVGQTIYYDGSYKGLNYPGGDIPRQTGVCTDVVIRAYRDAFDLDLQKLVHEDMVKNFPSYPKIWGLKRTDKNIDHRRVPNLEHFFRRKGLSLDITHSAINYLPGDMITSRLPGNLPHIAIVTHRPNRDKSRPLLVHNIGAGTRMEDGLFDYKIVGHFRFNPTG